MAFLGGGPNLAGYSANGEARGTLSMREGDTEGRVIDGLGGGRPRMEGSGSTSQLLTPAHDRDDQQLTEGMRHAGGARS